MRLYATPPKFSQIPMQIREDVPVYRLRDDIYTDDTLFLKGATLETTIDYVPNEAMFPVNQLAYDNYVAFLTEYDKKAANWNKLPVDKRSGFFQALPKLPAFLREWEKVNNLAQTKRIHLCKAIDMAPSILGAPRTALPRVTQVEMSNVPVMTGDDMPVIGKGNTLDKDMSAVNAVRNSLPAA